MATNTQRVKKTSYKQDTGTNTVTVTVPDAEIWEIVLLEARVTTSGTAGDRQPQLDIIAPDGTEIYTITTGTTIAASQTEVHVFAQIGLGDRETSTTANHIGIPLPEGLVLTPGWQLRLKDNQDTDGSSDSIDLRVLYQRDII